MALIGNLVKTALEWKGRLTPNSHSPATLQREQLRSLLNTAQSTAFGKYYNFGGIIASDDVEETYRNRVPIFDYHALDDKWWSQQQLYPDITWPGRPDFFALSSGTTGDRSKRIPITAAMIGGMRSVGFDQLTDFAQQDISAELFSKEIFILGSSADLDENQKGFYEGEISGINVNNFPSWYETFYRPGKEIAAIDNWEERIDRIAKEAPDWDIGAICGIPSWILMVLEHIIEQNGLSSIHDIWPHFSVYVSGGVALAPYRERFDQITDGEIHFMDTYLASEGFFGYSPCIDRMEMKLAVDHGIYYEFIPFSDQGFDEYGNVLANPTVLGIDQVADGEIYAPLITTCSGAWRYMIGDTIRFTDAKNCLFKIAGRTKFFLNVVGSQLSEEKINAGIKKVSEHFQVVIEEYCVSALKDEQGDIYHQWVVGSDEKIDDRKAIDILDGHLQRINKNYKVAKSKALSGVKLISVEKSRFYDALSGGKEMGGQLKTPKVMPADQMQDFLQKLDVLTDQRTQ